MSQNGNETEQIEALLKMPPFSLSIAEKNNYFLNAMQAAYHHHYQACPAYKNFCKQQGFHGDSVFSDVTAFPFLPVQAFKAFGADLASVTKDSVKLALHSSATSGQPSTILVDKITSKRQIKALSSILTDTFGATRRPFIIFDFDPKNRETLHALGARGAAIMGFLNLAQQVDYALTMNDEGGFHLDLDHLTHLINKHIENNEPLVMLGFTYVLYQHVAKVLQARRVKHTLPEGSFIAHIGGWKKLENQKVSKSVFNQTLSELFDLPTDHIIDFYGFTEQMGITYPDHPDGYKWTSAFSDVLVRDPQTYEILPDGETGLLEFLTPLPHSYPGIAILTDDMGYIVKEDQDNIKRFAIVGRAKKAEIRGCGDIMGDKLEQGKISRPVTAHESHASLQDQDAYLLFDAKQCYVPNRLNENIDYSRCPRLHDITTLADELKQARETLDGYRTEELMLLIHAAAEKWLAPDSPIAPLQQQGLLFLTTWCQENRLARLLRLSFPQGYGVLDGFKPIENSNRQMRRALPRGLCVHWLSGNVPLLGMLALSQAILTKNANILKAASSFTNVLPLLLDAFRDLEIKTTYGKTLYGHDILKTIAVIYYPHQAQTIADHLSMAADVRIAWGGKEAVEAVTQLPKKPTTEDVIYGPKLSFMAIAKDYLNTERALQKIARKAATDVAVFDQYACASPHTIFVEQGGEFASPLMFAKTLAQEMEKVALRIPKAPVDAGTAGAIAKARVEYAFYGKLWTSTGTNWTVLYDEKGEAGPVTPTYSRVITVRAIDNLLTVTNFAKPGIQSIGLAIDGTRKLQFAEQAAKRGIDRLPDIGRMTFFDSPWDGMFLMDRLVRWVVLGGPL